MEISEAIKNVKKFNEQRFRDCGVLNQSIDTVLNRLEDLENRYLELIINGNTFKIKNDVKKLQYIDFENNKFTLEVLEKWN